MKLFNIVAKAKGIVILKGVAYTPNQAIPSPLDEKTINDIRDNIEIESCEEIGGEKIENTAEKIIEKKIENKPKPKKVVEEAKPQPQEKKEEVEENSALDELFE